MPVALDISGRGVEHQRRIGHGAGQHAVDGDAVERFRQRPGGDAAALRLDAHQVRPRGGDADAAGAVGADRGGHQPRGHRGRATARRTPGVCRRDQGLRVCPNPGPLVNGH